MINLTYFISAFSWQELEDIVADFHLPTIGFRGPLAEDMTRMKIKINNRKNPGDYLEVMVAGNTVSGQWRTPGEAVLRQREEGIAWWMGDLGSQDVEKWEA